MLDKLPLDLLSLVLRSAASLALCGNTGRISKKRSFYVYHRYSFFEKLKGNINL